MASKWLQALPSTNRMLNKANKKNQASSKLGNGKASRITFEKYIAAHDTKPIVVLKSSSTNELVRSLEAKNRIGEVESCGESGESGASDTHKKRAAASPLETGRHLTTAGIKRQKTQHKNNHSKHM